MTVLREYEDFYNTHRPHRTLSQAAPLRPLPDGVTDLDHFRVRRRDRAGGVIYEHRLVLAAESIRILASPCNGRALRPAAMGCGTERPAAAA